jgi:hypothetical protein
LSLVAVGSVLIHGHAAQFSVLNHVVAGHIVDHLGVELGCQGFDQLDFPVSIPAVAD